MSYYYFLSKRKVLKTGIPEFWDIDTYTIYTLYAWEIKAVKKEEEMAKERENNNHNHPNNGDEVKDDPDMITMFRENVEDLEDEDP